MNLIAKKDLIAAAYSTMHAGWILGDWPTLLDPTDLADHLTEALTEATHADHIDALTDLLDILGA